MLLTFRHPSGLRRKADVTREARLDAIRPRLQSSASV
jgi:hypothetical protein